jgi:uncharacterized membrane protein YgdD (TMEM256/DUF423 family)
MHKPILTRAAILGAVAVALGAFGAHAIKSKLAVAHFEVYETAIKYLMIHCLALMGVGIIAWLQPSKWLNYASIAFTVGILIFSGTLLLLSFFRATGDFSKNWLGAITPVGGLLLIVGWVLVALAVNKLPLSKERNK